MHVKYVIIQAGGRGSRLGKYTLNKPKALLSVNGLPLILNTMKTFSGANFIVIGDYKFDVLRNYLRAFAKERYVLIRATGVGTCAGLREALDYVPDGEPFIVTWCDLYFSEGFELPSLQLNKNYIGLSDTFRCRWSFKDGKFVEEPSSEYGVAGFFVFHDKSEISDVPNEGEFVRYLSSRSIDFEPIFLRHVSEYGLVDEYEKLFVSGVARPFNRVTILSDRVLKEPTDEKGRELAGLELSWYEEVQKYGYKNVPRVYSLNPLILERLKAKHPFEIEPDAKIVENIVTALKELHDLQQRPALKQSYYREYYQKTFERLYQVKNIIPFTCQREMSINKKVVPNPFFLEDEIQKELGKYYENPFAIIHGDPTFSNTMVDPQGRVYFIDPRGYFGYNKIFGDPDYDFAKLYYSIVGNYDKFNRKRFALRIEEDHVELTIESNGYEQFEGLFFELVGSEKKEKIKLLHAVIWLSLTTYAWDDYDMMCGAFYNGALKLAEVLK